MGNRQKEIYDLIIAGGGISGAAAAIAAARAGLRVLLIEKANCLGGAAAHNLVNPFMPYWTMTTDGGREKKQYLSGGIFREILTELSSFGALDSDECMFHEEYLKLILNRMAQNAGVVPLFHSCVTEVERGSETLRSITVANKSGKTVFCAKYFIDATGDADLAVLSGCAYRLGREPDNLCQPMTLCFRVANVDMEKYTQSRHTINPLYSAFQKQGQIKNLREDVLIFDHPVRGVLHFNTTRIVRKNPVDAFDLTEAEIEAREQVFEIFHFLTENIDGFQDSQLLMTAAQIGVRESRMVEGLYTLTGDDLVSCRAFDDAIAVGNYDIDIHNPEGSGTSHYYFPPGQYYTIPYRCLIPKGVNNLLITGRCVSATHEAQASIRIMPIVCCLGEAAGTAVSIACSDGVDTSHVDIHKLRAQLAAHGAIL